jgi:hypothetical protein
MADEEIDSSGTELDLSNRHFWGSVTYGCICENLQPRMVHIDLSTNHLNSESAGYLADLLQSPECQVRYLSIVETRLINADATKIFRALGSSNLIELYADDNIFNGGNCQVLAEALARDPPLELLSLCGCDIPTEGAVAIASSLARNTHLQELRLESNSLFDTGAKAFGAALAGSSLDFLSLADNEIWADGMSHFLAGCAESRLTSLDVSYNTLDVDAAIRVLQEGRLERFAVSGCKVKQQDVPALLEAIGGSRLRMLMIDGFNYQVLPISWPKVDDTVWVNQECLDRLLSTVTRCQTLVDLRIGYLELDGIERFVGTCGSRELHLSIHDFGRTGNCWVLCFPQFDVLSPVPKFEWKRREADGEKPKEAERIVPANCHFLAGLICRTTCDGGPLREIDLHKTELNDNVFIGLLNALGGQTDFTPEVIDFSNNFITDNALPVLSEFLAKKDVQEIRISQNDLSDQACRQFFESLEGLGRRGPKKIAITFKAPATSELVKHDCFEEVANLVSQNYCLEELRLSGPVTAPDVICIVSSLSQNSHLRVLEFDSDFKSRYENPDPEIAIDVQKKFENLVGELHRALREKRTQCRLHTFKFPLLTEVFIYIDPVLEKWPECEERLETNKKGRPTSAGSRSRR